MLQQLLKYNEIHDLVDSLVVEYLEMELESMKGYLEDENSLFIGSDREDAVRVLKAMETLIDYFKVPEE